MTWQILTKREEFAKNIKILTVFAPCVPNFYIFGFLYIRNVAHIETNQMPFVPSKSVG